MPKARIFAARGVVTMVAVVVGAWSCDFGGTEGTAEDTFEPVFHRDGGQDQVDTGVRADVTGSDRAAGLDAGVIVDGSAPGVDAAALDAGPQGHDSGAQGVDAGHQGVDAGAQGTDAGHQGFDAGHTPADAGWPEMQQRWHLPSSSKTPALAADGSLYLVLPHETWEEKLVKVAADGSQLWELVPDPACIDLDPVLGPGGEAYLVCQDQYLMIAVSPQGEQQWVFKFRTPNLESLSWYTRKPFLPIVAASGVIYVGSEMYVNSSDGPRAPGRLWAVNPDGSQRWVHDVEYRASAPVLTREGTVIFVDDPYYGVDNERLKALDTAGNVLWDVAFPNGDLRTDVCAIGADDNLYMLDGCTVSDNGCLRVISTSNGQVLRETALPALHDLEGFGGLVLAASGTAYISWIEISSADRAGLWAIGPSGDLLWTFDQALHDANGVPALAADGTIYFISELDGSDSGRLFALRADGSVKGVFTMETGYTQNDNFYSRRNVSIGSDGTVYAQAWGDAYGLYAVVAHSPLATGGWPKVRGGAGNNPPGFGPGSWQADAGVGGVDAGDEVDAGHGAVDAGWGFDVDLPFDAGLEEGCGTECLDFLYTACTCQASDPCGWGNDGYCDADCEQLVAVPFDDGDDCG